MRKKSKRPRKNVKAAADRAVSRSAGHPVTPVAPILDAQPAREPSHTPHPETEQPASPAKPCSRRTKSQSLGRRHTYTDALGKAICTMLSDGMTLAQICRRPRMPGRATVHRWKEDEAHPFSGMYQRARQSGYEVMSDALCDISDDGRNDWMDRELPNGEVIRVIDPECVARSKLRVETRKWILARALPKIYGDKVTTTLNAGEGFGDVWRAISQQPLEGSDA